MSDAYLPEQTPPASPATTSQNLIVVHEEGLDDAALRRVLAPFANARQVSGIAAAAASDEADEDFERLTGAMAQSAVRSG
ncbi:MAG TPA: hypothetical protein PKZ99_02150 [Azospirillaceae bacterium]|nr:hypothetical protein [Azospirillaceae bacterium]